MGKIGSRKMMLRLPREIYQDVLILAEKNARNKNEEVLARLIATMQFNDEFMKQDRLMRLIFSKKLAYQSK